MSPSLDSFAVTDPIITQFAKAYGASSPLDLRVDLVDAKRRVAGTVAMPFALVGRDDACDVTLTDPEVNPRHAWLQVVGGRVLAIDLGSARVSAGRSMSRDRAGSIPECRSESARSSYGSVHPCRRGQLNSILATARSNRTRRYSTRSEPTISNSVTVSARRIAGP